MKAVQILMDEDLLSALDRSAKRNKRDRSKLVRDAVAAWLAAEATREKDRQLIAAYRKQPLTRDELDWLGAGEWPKD